MEKRNSLGGGILIAVGSVGGALYGAYHGQPSLGLVAGFGAGALLALGLWLVERGR